MSCHLCSRELEFSEIAGYNPNLPLESDDRTNYTMVNDIAEPICDDCYWSNEDDEEEDQDDQDEDEEDEDYATIYCVECGVVIENISLDDFSDDDEAAAAATSYMCDECNGSKMNPSTPELNGSPSYEEPPPLTEPPSYQP